MVPIIIPDPILNMAEPVPSTIDLGVLVENIEYVLDEPDITDIFNLCRLHYI